MPNKSSEHGGLVTVGTISHGTLRTPDLLFAFALEYERLLPFNSRGTVFEARELALHEPDSEQAAAMVIHLQDALSEIGSKERPELYFGPHEGDGSDFGFWEVN